MADRGRYLIRQGGTGYFDWGTWDTHQQLYVRPPIMSRELAQRSADLLNVGSLCG
ncbi:hypothetical protein ACFWUU_40300 [Kribbella sp. NPDC058693]|uniref:hypothetical protein n=1 Tax=Kribbella sp. NPDC058693 TaxID=3346602 RepID=UPI00365185BB